MFMPTLENILINHSFIQKFYQTIKQYDMMQKGDSVLVGVSGGPDSMALLHSLMALSDFMGLRLGVAHLNHCLRQKASNDDEKFVKSVAKKHGLPVFIEKKDILQEREKAGLSLEEAGREARYFFFNTVCRKKSFDKIAVGHHQDDNAELILLNLLRGSGPVGIGGIPPVRKNIIRPLIQTPRTEIIDYLRSRKIDYVIDQSNDDEQFARNKIRHQLLPLLKNTYNPKISQAINRLGAILQSEEEWINALTTPLFNQAVLHLDDQKIRLSVSVLLNFHMAAQRRIIRKAILEIKGDLRRITYSHIDSILHLINKDFTDAHLDLPDQIRILKQADHLIIQKEIKNLRIAKPPEKNLKPPVFAYLVSRSAAESEDFIYIHEIKTRITFSKTDRALIQNLSGQGGQTAFFDWEILRFPLIIRNFRPGDRFSPIGLSGTQKLKKFFINNKIKLFERAAIPIFLSGDMIVWVGGFRIADPVKITPETKTVLRVEIFTETEKS